MKKSFCSFYYDIKVVSPIHIGCSKDNDMMLGVDYYSENNNQLVFFNQNHVLKKLSPQLLKKYSTLVSKNAVREAAEMIKNICTPNPELKIKSVEYPFDVPNEIKRQYANGLGKITIPGSSIKGALRSCFGNYMINAGSMRPNNNNIFDELFGTINNNIMRFIQVSDVELDKPSNVIPMKIFSGDVVNNIVNNHGKLNYDGEGMWKDSTQGGHNVGFNEKGFVFAYETCDIGSKGKLRINWAKGLDDLVDVNYKPNGYGFFEDIKNNKWMAIAKKQMNDFIKKERIFYDKFYNKDFQVVFKLLDDLEEINNEENSVLIRLGAGTGYHSITGNWNYNDHTQTKQAQLRNRFTNQFENTNAIMYKTRKVTFSIIQDDEGELYDFHMPGFLKITVSS